MVNVLLRRPFEPEVIASIVCSRVPCVGESVVGAGPPPSGRQRWKVVSVDHIIVPFLPHINQPGAVLTVVEADEPFVDVPAPEQASGATYVSTSKEE